ncbi:MAG: cation-translocating P-type ATPase [Candidatus Thermoplasmatota archaeon]|nr:cation-translocating P-type ATPase [Candidatus Thermoplasmatota archaeon]
MKASEQIPNDTITSKGIETITGLSEVEAQKRLKDEGYNELPSQKRQNIFVILIHVVLEPMLLLLLGAGLIYVLLGEKQDALMLLIFVFVVVGITFYQQQKTERALEALKNLSSPRALVIRNGQQKRIPGREVVREDYIVLREGDRVPADAVVIFSSNLSIDESLLTGESLAVRKSEWDGKASMTQPGGDDLPFVFSGTLVVQGHGIARVLSIGSQTEMGKIGKALQKITPEETLLKKETSRLVKNFAIGGLILCSLVVIIYGITRGDWIVAFLAGVSLSMAILPEEFPVVLMIFMSLGAWRMSKRQVLTRNTASIEMLGAATMLCVDKTGTLTQNKMILSSLFCDNQFYNMEKNCEKPLPECFHDLLEYGNLASQRDPFDPIEKEIKRTTEKFLQNTEHIHDPWKLVREYPLSKHLLTLSHVWESQDKRKHVISAKGAPEAIADLCHFTKEQTKELLIHIKEMTDKGLRVLGVARSSFKEDSLPDKQHDFEYEFVGLLGFVDPVRLTVAPSLKECYTAGMRMIMITGDYPGTAQHIARQIGLKNPEKFITGPELSQMNPDELREKIKTINIFARVIPEQKLAIVDALKANGEIVAMTGDGVNDAPALKSSHIGIAMGERGTDVARESSSIVLLNDDFSSIVQAVRLGRRIFDNLRKSISYIFSVHIPIAGMALIPVLMGLPLVLLPAHIAFLELIIDPACSTVFEAEREEKNIMNRPPRNLKERLFGRKNLLYSFIQGLSVLIAVIFIFLWFYNGTPAKEDQARTLSFATLVIANIMLIIVNLSGTHSLVTTVNSKNKALWLVVIGAILTLLMILLIPFLQNLFHFSPIPLIDFFIATIAGIISVSWFKVIDLVKRKSHMKPT